MSLDAYKMMLVQNFVQGIGRAQSYEEVYRAIQEVQFSLSDDDDYDDEYVCSLNAPCDLPPYTVDELRERVARSVKGIGAGLGTPHEEFMKELDEYVASL